MGQGILPRQGRYRDIVVGSNFCLAIRQDDGIDVYGTSAWFARMKPEIESWQGVAKVAVSQRWVECDDQDDDDIPGPDGRDSRGLTAATRGLIVLRRDGTAFAVGYDMAVHQLPWADVADVFADPQYFYALEPDGTLHIVRAVTATERFSYKLQGGIADVVRTGDVSLVIGGNGIIDGFPNSQEDYYDGIHPEMLRGVVTFASVKTSYTEIDDFFGIRADGTLVRWYDTWPVVDWNDVVTAEVTDGMLVALRGDGTIVAEGKGIRPRCYFSKCMPGESSFACIPYEDALGWIGIVAMSAGTCHVVGLRDDGTVATSGREHVVDGWHDVTKIGAGRDFTVALTNDGRLLSTAAWGGADGLPRYPIGLDCTEDDEFIILYAATVDEAVAKVRRATDIKSIAMPKGHLVLLCDHGNVVALPNGPSVPKLDTSSWTGGIRAIRANECCVVGLKEDGRILVACVGGASDGTVGGNRLLSWDDIVDVALGDGHILGLRGDGTVVAGGDNSDGQCETDAWTDMIGISASPSCSVGARRNGRVAWAGRLPAAEEDAAAIMAEWQGIIQVAVTSHVVIGLQGDGTVVAIGDADLCQEVASWRGVVDIVASDEAVAALTIDGIVRSTLPGTGEWRGIDRIAVCGDVVIGWEPVAGWRGLSRTIFSKTDWARIARQPVAGNA